MTTEAFIATSIARRLMARIQLTHERRGVSVFAGPPGIGKTTVLDEFAARAPGKVVVVKIARRPAREVLVLQHVLDGFRRLGGGPSCEFPGSAWQLRKRLFGAICALVGEDDIDAGRSGSSAASFPRLTVAFDEAQNLSRAAIEAVRYWNDADRCYAPFPLGLVFVGNSEFSLRTDSDGQSPISTAVADRALYIQTFDYGDVTDDDLRLFMASRGVGDEGAIAAVIRYFRMARAGRSLRQVTRLLDDLAMLASGEMVTAATVREAVGVG